ncbi:hypothetical protein L484_022657 [Morus notabilis]|uniref:Uncharacterized protein n=1 Tax=Morus notabilis TaxID=981085 RepID=W9QXV8_9ROSA|nr:hypothetical protein L484_022657 [Morus notabilis]
MKKRVMLHRLWNRINGSYVCREIRINGSDVGLKHRTAKKLMGCLVGGFVS